MLTNVFVSFTVIVTICQHKQSKRNDVFVSDLELQQSSNVVGRQEAARGSLLSPL